MEIEQPDFGRRLGIWEYLLDHYCSEKEDELSFARDIAEFEKNRHLAKPSNTLDGMRVERHHFVDYQTRISVGPGCWMEGGHGSWIVKEANQPWQSINCGSENVPP